MRSRAPGHMRLDPVVEPFEANWISYRSSRANIDRRADRHDTAPVCAGCGCETDVRPVPHSPRCTGEAA